MTSPTKPQVGDRAETLVDDAFNYARLTQITVDTDSGETGPAGKVATAVAVRAAIIALAVKYNLPGTEIAEMRDLANWRLRLP